MNRLHKCPECGSYNVAEIVYDRQLGDYPTLQEDLKAGKIVLGGVCCYKLVPKHFCNSCQHKFDYSTEAFYKDIFADAKVVVEKMLEESLDYRETGAVYREFRQDGDIVGYFAGVIYWSIVGYNRQHYDDCVKAAIDMLWTDKRRIYASYELQEPAYDVGIDYGYCCG